MENASKALIIAGAIILAILIIGLGMFIYQQAAGAIGDTGIDTAKVNAYNNPFVQYEGTRTGSEVKQLCQTVIAHNTQAKDASEFIKMQETAAGTVTTNGAQANATAATFNTAITTIKNKMLSGRNYTVSIGYDAKTGYVCAIGIVEVK